ncbi:mucin-5AC-like [Dendronephthya gigantea]|uniref:mucin-5AC-like n=1 Tax=Dendronephthya gigantea TaxID=151771 RepID=UPI00106C5CCA|nr:mucin-5AC-like [Dendronephthya gigantea]
MLRTALFCFTISALSTARARPSTERPTNGAHLCEYDSRFYVSGEIFNKKSAGEGKCSGMRCDNGVVTAWDAVCSTVAPTMHRTIRRKTTKRHRTTIPQTTTPFITTLPIATTPVGCNVDGKFYYPGEEIESGADRRSGWCYGSFCDEEGNVVAWDNFNCFPTTTPEATTTPSPPTSFTPERTTAEPTFSERTSTELKFSPSSTRNPPPSNIPPHTGSPYSTDPLGCKHNGKFYGPGDEISRESDGHGSCFGLFCDHKGNIIPWDNFDCAASTLPPTTPPSTTTPPRLGCLYKGKLYAPFEIIRKGSKGNWCGALICDKNSQVTTWDDGSCGSTTTKLPTVGTHPPTAATEPPSNPSTNRRRTVVQTYPPKATTRLITIPPSTIPPYITFPHLGCEYEGRFYAPGDDISKGSDGEGWCYGLYCDDEGNVIPWDDWNCGTTTPPQTTLPYTTPPPRPGCHYEGKFYLPGKEISRGSDGEGWCFGEVCDESGQVTTWDDWSCGTTTPTIITTAPTKAPTTSTTNPPTQTTHKTSSTEQNTQFTTSSTVNTLPTTSPKEPTSRSTTPLHTTPTSIGWCYFNGQYFVRGEVISRVYHTRKWCSGWYCNDGKIDPWNDFNCENPNAPQVSTTSAPQCYFNGVYYNEGEVVPGGEGSGACEGSYCSGGQLIPFEGVDCGSSAQTNSSTQEFNVSSTNTDSLEKQSRVHTTKTTEAPTVPFTTTSTASLVAAPSRQAEDSNTTAAPKLCFHEGKYYEEGDIISRDFDADDWCSGWYCKEGRLISLDCDVTSSVVEEDSPKPIPPKTLSSEPSRCFHEGRYYEEGDLATIGNDWCSGLLCQSGTMIQFDECLIKNLTPSEGISPPTLESNVSTPTTDAMEKQTQLSATEKTTKAPVSTLTQTRTPRGTTLPRSTALPTPETTKRSDTTPAHTTETLTVTQGKDTTKPPEISLTQPSTASPITSPTPQTEATSSSPEPKLCFHEGKYYEEGDIISRDFDGNDWCSGWYCKGGRLISLDCGGITGPKTEAASSLELTPPIGPEPSRCFHEGRYYEEGDLATIGNDWCSGLLCKDGVMIQWDDCPIKKLTPSTEVNQPTQESIVSVTITDSMEKQTKLSTTETTKSTELPKTTKPTEERTTTTLPDPTTTPKAPTKPQKTTAGQPIRTTKPEKQKCYYKGKLYSPGEVTRGALRDGRCYGVICDISGIIVQWVTHTCAPTEAPTAEITASLPGCVHRDKYYPPGRISRISDGSKWCMDVMCTEEGKIVSRSVNCDQSTTTFTTPSPTKTSASDPNEVKCLYNGAFHFPGVIEEGIDKNQWCYKVVCQDNGQLYLWGDWNCKFTFRSTTTSPPDTTTPGPAVCTYNGKPYPVGEITRGENKSGWCFGVTCRPDGQVVLWGSFKCGKI